VGFLWDWAVAGQIRMTFSPSSKNRWLQFARAASSDAQTPSSDVGVTFLAPLSQSTDARLLWIDRALAFIALERNLILRNIRIVTQSNMIKAFSTAMRLCIVINAHIWGFWALGRPLPGTISYVTFCAAGFTSWYFFAVLVRSGVPWTMNANFNKSLNIKWMHLYIAHIVWESLSILTAFTITLLFYTIFPIRYLGTPVGVPNVLLLFLSFALCAMLGAGFGLVLHSTKVRWPVLDAMVESIMWVFFVTSGVYMPYASLSWFVTRYEWFSPVVAPLENSRRALDSTYPVLDLSLTYSFLIALLLLFLGLAIRDWERKVRFP
jgi:ABC-type polysaccharide/polyol phosphate export permease